MTPTRPPRLTIRMIAIALCLATAAGAAMWHLPGGPQMALPTVSLAFVAWLIGRGAGLRQKHAVALGMLAGLWACLFWILTVTARP